MTLTKGARALWVTAGAWSSAQLTDGHVPSSVIAMLGGNKSDTSSLVSSGMWRTTAEGFQFHDWPEYQPTRKDVQTRRAKDADRLRKWREQRDTAGQ